MYKYLQVGEISIPSYSMMIIVGLVICNLVAQRTYKSDCQKYKTFLLLELFGGIGAIVGAKVLTVIRLIMREGIFPLSWKDFSDAGYSYYGGLAGYFIIAYLVCKIKDIDGQEMAHESIYLLPLLHSFWKIGCLLGGCCYGSEYSGYFAITYPAGVNPVSGVSVFPSPLLEAIVSLLISLILLLVRKSTKKIECVGLFFILYGTTRFFLEFYRYHDISSILSEGQVYSVICAGIGFYLHIGNMRRKRNDE